MRSETLCLCRYQQVISNPICNKSLEKIELVHVKSDFEALDSHEREERSGRFFFFLLRGKVNSRQIANLHDVGRISHEAARGRYKLIFFGKAKNQIKQQLRGNRDNGRSFLPSRNLNFHPPTCMKTFYFAHSKTMARDSSEWLINGLWDIVPKIC